jgi:hypothetical protein
MILSTARGQAMEPDSQDAEKQLAIQRVAHEMEVDAGRLAARAIPNDFFRSWTVWRVEDDSLPPLVVMVATRGQDVRPLKLEQGLGPLVEAEPVQLTSPDQAVRYVEWLLSVAQPLSDVLRAVDEIPGISDGNRTAWKDKVTPLVARATKDGHEVEAWLLQDGDLVHARFAIDGGGKVASNLKVAAPKVGVSIAIE